jgi:threonine synthase
MAKELAQKNNFLLAATGIDPTRVEAKKTMIYEIYRKLQRAPSSYIQALSGGTGPIGIFKGTQELINHGILKKQPKLLLIQSNKCAPMADGYQNAKQNNFKGDWNKKYPVYENPDTLITTIATGNPTLYSYVSSIVKKSDGDILSVDENFAKDTSKLIALTQGVMIGPAAAIAIEGYFKSLKNKLIKNGDLIIINIGEGIKRSPDYLEQFTKDEAITTIDECKIENINTIRENAINEYIKIIKDL